jgi:hypothetical protein
MPGKVANGPAGPGIGRLPDPLNQVQNPLQVQVQSRTFDPVPSESAEEPGNPGRRFTRLGHRWMNEKNAHFLPRKNTHPLLAACSQVIIAWGRDDLDGEEIFGKTLTGNIGDQTDLRFQEIRNPNIEIRNKFKIQKVKKANKERTFEF